ncbi:unnamed protein product, partial [Linum tenue]
MPPTDAYYCQHVILVARGVTRTAVFPVIGFRLAAFSRRCHASFLFSAKTLSCSSSSLNWARHDRKSCSSISENIFLMLRVKLSTPWFQWFCAFFSNAGNMIGRITCRLCAIKFTIWSLFHKKRARSA